MLILVSNKFGSFLLRIFTLAAVVTTLVFTAAALYFLDAYQNTENSALNLSKNDSSLRDAEPFPFSVYPDQKKIIESDAIELFLNGNLAIEVRSTGRTPLLKKIEKRISQSGLFQQLASPQSRVLVIWSGERKEEILNNISKILKWDASEKENFLNIMQEKTSLSEGMFFPGNYVVRKDATASEVANAVFERFDKEILERYPDDTKVVIPIEDALTIASLLEREAYSFEHMRIISGVIWNRLFINMPLQLDATLQYVRGNESNENWWPVPVPKDKFLQSPYNTYQNKGLPPEPIANPSVSAILAALNPIQSDCLFYFHDDSGEIYCSQNYEQHNASLRKVFGSKE